MDIEETSSFTQIRLNIKLQKGTRSSPPAFRLRWSLPTSDPSHPFHRGISYQVAQSDLVQASQNVREKFQIFATAIVDLDYAAHPHTLQDLAEAGEELYDSLFADVSDRAKTAEFRKWFESEVVCKDEKSPSLAYALEVVIDMGLVSRPNEATDSGELPEIGVPPLGLVFTPRPDRSTPADISFDDYIDFWANCLRCSTFTEHQYGRGRNIPLNGDDFETVILRETDDTAYTVANKRLSKTWDLSHKQTDHGLGMKAGFSKVYQGKGVLIYFDIKSTGSPGAMSIPYDAEGDPRFTANHVRSIIKEAANDRGVFDTVQTEDYALAVIDRDALIRGDRGREWLPIFFSAPWIGLVAVEGDVVSAQEDWDESKQVRPDRFLGLLFLRSLLQRNNQKMIDSLLDARRECWPFSLFYGVYCCPTNPWIKDQPDLVRDIDHLIPVLSKDSRHPINLTKLAETDHPNEQQDLNRGKV